MVEWLVSFVFSSFVCCFITVLVSFWWEEHFWLLTRSLRIWTNKQQAEQASLWQYTQDIWQNKTTDCKCIKEDMYTNTQAINIFALTANPERHTKVWKSNSSNSNLKENYNRFHVSWFFSSVSSFSDFSRFEISNLRFEIIF